MEKVQIDACKVNRKHNMRRCLTTGVWDGTGTATTKDKSEDNDSCDKVTFRP
jgi:hypothetical protein